MILQFRLSNRKQVHCFLLPVEEERCSCKLWISIPSGVKKNQNSVLSYFLSICRVHYFLGTSSCRNVNKYHVNKIQRRQNRLDPDCWFWCPDRRNNIKWRVPTSSINAFRKSGWRELLGKFEVHSARSENCLKTIHVFRSVC